MIAIGILSTWLLLTSAGFKGLSVLTSVGVREEIEANAALTERRPGSWAASRLALPKALPR